MPKKSGKKKIVVAGDITIDWNLAARAGVGSFGDSGMHPELGGAGRLAQLIERMCGQRLGDGAAEVTCLSVPSAEQGLRLANRSLVHSFLLFEQKPTVTGEKKAKAWRVGRFLGYGGRPEAGAAPRPNPTRADVVVLDDADYGFRDAKQLWPKACLGSGTAGWIVHKVAGKVARGDLWEELAPQRGRTVAVVSINDLRSEEILISKGISWERTCEELAWELRFGNLPASLSECAHVVVVFPYAGAFIFSNAGNGEADDVTCELVFDPVSFEEQWASGRPGNMIGSTSILAASIASELAVNPEEPKLAEAAAAGLKAAADLFERGYEEQGEGEDLQLRFPLGSINIAAARKGGAFLRASIRCPWEEGFKEGWTILETMGKEDLHSVGAEIVRDGLKKGLKGAPIATFGGLQTVDRSEIESYNAIRNLISGYLEGDASKPVSFAVFGPPGAGKSFGIKQIAKNLAGKMPMPEFNLSQFNDPKELYAAFHTVRDATLKGQTPLVFWDEFDSGKDEQKLFWLKYFLMPMQDGAFREGELEHPIGRAIFVFAGGTCATFKEFCDQGVEEPDWFKGVKGPDFVSRLKGHINILGPNQRMLDHKTVDSTDRFYPIRRAVIFRSLLERGVPQIVDGKTVNIDDGVLSAFLKTSKFKHGVRSMESIISMSNLANRCKFERSALPTPQQISAHVGPDFLRIVQRPPIDGRKLDQMAAKAHGLWRKNKWTAAASRSMAADERLEKGNVPYAKASEEYRRASRALVRKIPEHIESAGCVLVPVRGKSEPVQIPGALLERLAIQEHARWNRDKLGAGFAPGYPRDNVAKVHPNIVSWDGIPEKVKEYDRVFFRGVSAILAVAGFTVKVMKDGAITDLAGEPEKKAFRIGVVGRRLLNDPDAVGQLVEKELEKLETLPEKDQAVEVVSSLAEGSDRLVAGLATRHFKASLKVPLPLPKEEYVKTFEEPGSVEEFEKFVSDGAKLVDLAPGVAPAAFTQAGEYVAMDCDVVFVLWDGEDDAGEGGTKSTVKALCDGETDWIWIHTKKLKVMSAAERKRVARALTKK